MPERPSAPRRGDIYRVDFDNSRGSEPTSGRLAVVISTDLFNGRTPVVVVAAITRQVKPWSDVAVTLPAGKPLNHKCQILVFQIKTVDKSRLRKYKGCLDPDQLEQLRKAMRATWEL